MQGVKREQGRHEPAAPDRAGHTAQDPKEQEGVGDMDQETGQVMPAGV